MMVFLRVPMSALHVTGLRSQDAVHLREDRQCKAPTRGAPPRCEAEWPAPAKAEISKCFSKTSRHGVPVQLGMRSRPRVISRRISGCPPGSGPLGPRHGPGARAQPEVLELNEFHVELYGSMQGVRDLYIPVMGTYAGPSGLGLVVIT